MSNNSNALCVKNAIELRRAYRCFFFFSFSFSFFFSQHFSLSNCCYNHKRIEKQSKEKRRRKEKNKEKKKREKKHTTLNRRVVIAILDHLRPRGRGERKQSPRWAIKAETFVYLFSLKLMASCVWLKLRPFGIRY